MRRVLRDAMSPTPYPAAAAVDPADAILLGALKRHWLARHRRTGEGGQTE